MDPSPWNDTNLIKMIDCLSAQRTDKIAEKTLEYTSIVFDELPGVWLDIVNHPDILIPLGRWIPRVI